LGEVLTTPHRKNVPSYEMFTQKTSDMDGYFGAQYRDRWRARVNVGMNTQIA